MTGGAGSTKITPPRLRDVVARTRLFSLLDEMGEAPVVWVSSPAGSGKTTLIASYLESRGIPFLWYRIDEADHDVANFFYYMSEGAKSLKGKRSERLPLFTPEYRSGMSAFVRQYFESFFSRMTLPYAVVFDNYQDVREQSPFHEVMKNGLAIVPEGVRIFIASREDYPPPFVSLKVGSVLAALGWEHIRFTLDEARAMMFHRKKGPVPEEVVQNIYRQTKGWAAATILLSECEPAYLDHRPVFDYLAVEVFQKLPDRLRTFLLKTSLLPTLSVEMVEKVTGMEECEEILSGLRGHYFTESYGTVYSYHPLFREFLMSEAKKTYRDEFASLVRKAGAVLAEAGQIEEAIKLLLDAKAYADALPLIIDKAPELLKQGRGATLEEWTAKMPCEIADSAPPLSYWLGMGRLITDPTFAKKCFTKAFRIFEGQGNETGCLLAASAVINAIVLEWDDARALDPWIEWIGKKAGPTASLPSADVEAKVASAMVAALWRRVHRHPDMDAWIERTLRASEKVEDVHVRFTARASVMEYYGVYGHFEEMRHVATEFRKTAFLQNMSPLAHLMYMVRIKDLADWLTGSWEETIELVRKALHTAEEWGAFSHLGAIYVTGVLAAFEMDDLDTAADFMRKMDQAVPDQKSAIRLRSSLRKTFYLFRKERLSEARSEAGVCLEMAARTGVPRYEALARMVTAYVLRLMGDSVEALRQLELVKKIAGPPRPPDIIHYLISLTDSIFAFDNNDRAAGLNALREAFCIGRTKGYAATFYFWWQPDEMARLCTEALAAGIEVEYAREVIRVHKLTPHGSLEALAQWPWPVRIFTLGRFGIEVNEKALVSTGKGRKPLELLKALISFGGKEVSEERLTDALWPDVDGDLAHRSFDTTLHRLRRLIGNSAVLQVRAGKLSLDFRQCWVDSQAFEEVCGKIETVVKNGRSETALTQLFEALLNLYGGDFLANDEERPWKERRRSQLRSMHLSALNRAGSYWMERKQWQRATEWYRRAVEADALAEEPYQRLMKCYREQGKVAEAEKAYRMCCSALSDKLHASPSMKTREIYESVVRREQKAAS